MNDLIELETVTKLDGTKIYILKIENVIIKKSENLFEIIKIIKEKED